MTSPQFVEYVERKLRENGVAKIVPDQDLLAEAYMSAEKGLAPAGGNERNRRKRP